MSLLKRFSWFWLAIVMQPTFHSYAAEVQAPSTIVQFCAPQNDVLPFFITQNGQLKGINPDMMRQIFNENTFPNVTLKFIRLPWKRCNLDLESGKVDMMIGGYDANRKEVVYPSQLGFNLEDTVISTANVCFFSVPGSQMQRARRGMEGKARFIVGIEAGFSKRHDSQIDPSWVELFNPIEKYRMLEKGRVDAIVQVCAMDGEYPIATQAEANGYSNFETLYPPYLSNPAYVVFSKNFASNHNALAKRIITASQNIDKSQVYLRYKPKG